MASHHILRINAACTSACAVGLLAARGTLPSLFGLGGPLLLDGLAVGLLGYAAALMAASRQRPVRREALMAFTLADVLWVVGSAAVLLLFWAELAPLARFLVVAAAVMVEVFATLQFRAAGGCSGPSRQTA